MPVPLLRREKIEEIVGFTERMGGGLDCSNPPARLAG
jgi:hypothetical protein